MIIHVLHLSLFINNNSFLNLLHVLVVFLQSHNVETDLRQSAENILSHTDLFWLIIALSNSWEDTSQVMLIISASPIVLIVLACKIFGVENWNPFLWSFPKGLDGRYSKILLTFTVVVYPMVLATSIWYHMERKAWTLLHKGRINTSILSFIIW
jgi:hypothetical protein